MDAVAAGAATHGVLDQPHGVAHLQRLNGRVHRVGHVGVDGGEAVGAWAGTGAAAHGLVVGEGGVAGGVPAADGDVVHRAGAGGRDALRQGWGEGTEDDVDDALGGLDVAGRHCSGRAGVHDGALREGEGHGPETAVVGGHGLIEQAADDVVYRGAGDGGDGVHGRGPLG